MALALLAGCGQRARDLDSLLVVDSLYVDSTGVAWSGPVFRTFQGDAGRLEVEGSLRAGLWDGELVVYHPNGRVRYMGSFAAGERCGPWTENADSLPTDNAYDALMREVATMALYPPCADGRVPRSAR